MCCSYLCVLTKFKFQYDFKCINSLDWCNFILVSLCILYFLKGQLPLETKGDGAVLFNSPFTLVI